jgi:hypothetical protein
VKEVSTFGAKGDFKTTSRLEQGDSRHVQVLIGCVQAQLMGPRERGWHGEAETCTFEPLRGERV